MNPYDNNPFEESHIVEFDDPKNEHDAFRELLKTRDDLRAMLNLNETLIDIARPALRIVK